MYKEMHELAIVTAGYAFRSAVKSDVNGHIFIFQAKDFIQGQTVVSINALTTTSQDVPGYKMYLKKNDVLLVARGMKTGSFRSTVFASDAHNVIASSSVHIIRVIDPRVLPEFISLYLNSKEGQEAILQIVTGSYIGAVPRRKLERLKIPLLSLERQKRFVELDQNIREQKRITSRQNEIKQNIINATFRDLIIQK